MKINKIRTGKIYSVQAFGSMKPSVNSQHAINAQNELLQAQADILRMTHESDFDVRSSLFKDANLRINRVIESIDYILGRNDIE